MTFQGDNMMAVKRNNRSAALRILHEKGEMSRKKLAESMQLTPAAITKIVAEMLGEGLLLEGDAVTSGSVGRREIPVALNVRCVAALGMLINGQAGLSDMSGPVGVVRIVAEETQKNGPEAYILLLIFISVNLGLVNLMPIPGLDGAQIILLLVEAIRRKPLSRKTEAYIKLVGFAALMLLFVTLTFQDISGIFRGGR